MFETDNKHAKQLAGNLGLLQLKTATLKSTGSEKELEIIRQQNIK
jgi:hypothetical protein